MFFAKVGNLCAYPRIYQLNLKIKFNKGTGAGNCDQHGFIEESRGKFDQNLEF